MYIYLYYIFVCCPFGGPVWAYVFARLRSSLGICLMSFWLLYGLSFAICCVGGICTSLQWFMHILPLSKHVYWVAFSCFHVLQQVWQHVQGMLFACSKFAFPEDAWIPDVFNYFASSPRAFTLDIANSSYELTWLFVILSFVADRVGGAILSAAVASAAQAHCPETPPAAPRRVLHSHHRHVFGKVAFQACCLYKCDLYSCALYAIWAFAESLLCSMGFSTCCVRLVCVSQALFWQRVVCQCSGVIFACTLRVECRLSSKR